MAAQSATWRAPGIEERQVFSKAIGEAFRISVWQPVRRCDHSERFPVVYVTDADEYFQSLVTLANAMQFHGESPRFILVGIGYAESRAASLLRMRDFYTPEIREFLRPEIEAFARSPQGIGLVDLSIVMHSTGAKEFLQFIRDELRSVIDADYPSLPGESTYFGYSSGGAFGFYALFNEPRIFARYILGSPVTTFGGRYFAEEFAQDFVARGGETNAALFLSAGELEDSQKSLQRFQIVSGVSRLTEFLERRPVPGLAVALRILTGETHGSAWAPAFSHGVRALFGPAVNVPFAPEHR